MTDITIPRETVQQALDALENSSTVVYQDIEKSHLREAAITALRTALAAPAAQPLTMLFGTLPVHDCTEQKPASDYRDWDYQDHLDSHPTSAAREPLTKDEIQAAYTEHDKAYTFVSSVWSFEAGVAFAEQHHGIGAKEQK